LLFKVIRASFGKRRKTLRNALLMGELGLEPERLDKAFEKAGVDPGRRAETLALNEFAELTDAILS
jgi:16S rRNA (adenine1518-N6/adenine1519-N6)-dimethyltransferase